MEVNRSFSEFKENFYRRVRDFSVFGNEEINLLKVVLDGLKVDYCSRGKIRVFIFRGYFLINFFFLLKRIKTFFSGKNTSLVKQLKKKREVNSKYIAIDAGARTV